MIESMSAWKFVRLSDLAEDISYGYTATSSLTANGPKLLRITDIQDGKVNWATVPFCTGNVPQKFSLRSGDIVIARTGATTGKSFLLRSLPERAVFASYLIRVRANQSVLPEYLDAFFHSSDYWSQIQQVSKGTAQPGANASILSTLIVPLAPHAEQKRIVAKIDSLSTKSKRARDNLDYVRKLIDHLDQAVLAKAFRGELVPQDPNDEPASALLERIRAERQTSSTPPVGDVVAGCEGERK